MTLPVPSAKPRIGEMDLGELEPGDVLLLGDDNYPGWLLMQRLLYGADYSHIGMYVGDGDVIDSDTDKGVTRHPLKDLLTSHRIQVLRPDYRTGADRQAALEYCENQKGKPFDVLLDTEHDDAFYCAELVAGALGSMPNPMMVASRTMLGRRIIAPDALRYVEGMKTVTSRGGGFFSAFAGYWPFVASAAVCALTGTIGGPLGAVAAGVTGIAGSIVAGDLADPHLRAAVKGWIDQNIVMKPR